MSIAERRRRIVADVEQRTGIDEAMIDRLVRSFYAKVQRDPLLGPVFAARVEAWEPHLERIRDFWSSVVLLTGRYHGRPMELHQPLPIDAEHFDRWLELFAETAQELCPPEAAALFVERAKRVAESLELAVATDRGVMLRRGERYRRPAGKGGRDA